MSRFDKNSIEVLISKAKALGLSRLRVAEDGGEVCIELPRAPRASKTVEVPKSTPASEREIISQFVGYFRPTAEPGASVSKDAVIGVVESLGLPNDVVAPISGRLSDFAVSDGDAVEYGTVIARIQT